MYRNVSRVICVSYRRRIAPVRFFSNENEPKSVLTEIGPDLMKKPADEPDTNDTILSDLRLKRVDPYSLLTELSKGSAADIYEDAEKSFSEELCLFYTSWLQHNNGDPFNVLKVLRLFAKFSYPVHSDTVSFIEQWIDWKLESLTPDQYLSFLHVLPHLPTLRLSSKSMQLLAKHAQIILPSSKVYPKALVSFLPCWIAIDPKQPLVKLSPETLQLWFDLTGDILLSMDPSLCSVCLKAVAAEGVVAPPNWHRTVTHMSLYQTPSTKTASLMDSATVLVSMARNPKLVSIGKKQRTMENVLEVCRESLHTGENVDMDTRSIAMVSWAFAQLKFDPGKRDPQFWDLVFRSTLGKMRQLGIEDRMQFLYAVTRFNLEPPPMWTRQILRGIETDSPTVAAALLNYVVQMCDQQNNDIDKDSVSNLFKVWFNGLDALSEHQMGFGPMAMAVTQIDPETVIPDFWNQFCTATEKYLVSFNPKSRFYVLKGVLLQKNAAVPSDWINSLISHVNPKNAVDACNFISCFVLLKGKFPQTVLPEKLVLESVLIFQRGAHALRIGRLTDCLRDIRKLGVKMSSRDFWAPILSVCSMKMAEGSVKERNLLKDVIGMHTKDIPPFVYKNFRNMISKIK